MSADMNSLLLSDLLNCGMLFICAAMCYFPMTDKLKISVKKLISAAVPSIALFAFSETYISARFGISHNFIAIPACVLMFAAYCRTLDADIYECLFVFTFAASVSCYPYHYALEIDALTNPEGSYKLLPVRTELVRLAFMLITAAAYYIVRKPVSEFVSELKRLPLRKIFWAVPCFYAVMLITFIPMDYKTLYTGRIIYIYPIVITVIFITQITFIYLFCRITKETLYNEELLRSNQMLEFQSKRFESLKLYMEQTKHIRHDFRQQLRTINSLIENNNYGEARKFLSEYTEDVRKSDWESFCKNSAADAIAGYYAAIARSDGINIDWSLELPEKLPVSEPVFCGMLGNLIENAIDGCKTVSDGERIIHLSAIMPGSAIIVLVIENTFDGNIRTDGAGRPLTSKHGRNGVGLESAKAIAEKYRGNIKIEYNDRSFRVSILLNAD